MPTTSPDRPWSDLSRPPLRAAALRAALVAGPQPAWRELVVLAATGSTNADLAEQARAGAGEGLVLVTDDQRSGRGRLGRSWEVPARSSIAVSVLLRPAAPGLGWVDADLVPQERWSWLPLLAGVAVVDALTRVCGLPARLKWPNDVLVPADGRAPRGGIDPDGLRKVCGILAEVVPTPGGPAVVVGAGINVNQAAAELPVPTATSLLLAGSSTVDRDTVLRAYLRALSDRYRSWRGAGGDPRGSGLAAAYREACVTVGRQVAVQLPVGPALTGRAEGIDDDGRLLVAGPDGTVRALAAGDVVHVRPPAGAA
ncbi:MAG TPA: biotin--[acetyl-CoA-carboxylase] ligase [Kineosporiaceae bacterium]|nr:biotin--[acetyl-CoA-carboxylase] ligase [Kineosporiaceae bacterium]